MFPNDIMVNAIRVPDNPYIAGRNTDTLQAAIIRGETEVTFHNWSFVPRQLWDRIRHNGFPLGERTTLWYQEQRINRTPKKVDAAAARRDIDNVQWKGFKLEFIKVLAAGGHGYVSLWKVWFEDGSSKKVVIKRGLEGFFQPEKESRFHLRYAGAEHTCQILDLHAEAMKIQQEVRRKNPLVPLQYRNGPDFSAKFLDVLVFEHMEHGDMHDMLTMAGHRQMEFSNRALWGIWECLVRGVAACAYVPTFRAMNRDFEQELRSAIEENHLERFLRQLENVEMSHDVHLDMEEYNILAGKADTHPHQPIFKLHDLGAFSFIMSENWKRWDDYDYWRMRQPCKIHRVAPEQVHQDWDQLRTDDGVNLDGSQFAGEDLTQGHRIAGRFGTWTNIFLIAKVMESVITLYLQVYPFDAGYMDSLDGTQSGNTYGWLLQDPVYSHFDAELRDIILQCQFELPGERPSITTLLRQIAIRNRQPFEETPEDMAECWREFFGPSEPAPMPDPMPPADADAIEPQHQIPRRPVGGPPTNLRVPQRIARRPVGDPPAPPVPTWLQRTDGLPSPSFETVDLNKNDTPIPDMEMLDDAEEAPSQFSWAPGESRTHLNRARAKPDGSLSESGGDEPPVRNTQRRVRFNQPKRTTRQGKTKRTGSTYDRSGIKQFGTRVNKRVSGVNTHTKTSNFDMFAQTASDDGMPIAIRNLMVRSKYLEQRLADGNFPDYAYTGDGKRGMTVYG
ncbi:hypothetical protein ACHAPT_005890 [Fusarium lateritium]